MPISAVEPLYENVPIEFRRARWTRDHYRQLVTAGVDPKQFELLEGELVDRMGKKRPHVNALLELHSWLTQVFGKLFVNTEAPIDVAPGDNAVNEPEPDLIVLTRPSWEYSSNPPPNELRPVIEISDSSLGLDLKRKSNLYARASIAEYWVVDIPNHRIIVHRQPAEGRYQSVIAYLEHESVTPHAAPEALFEVRRAFLPQTPEA
ncbi:MAG: Uma2 family endonuclease [Bryobacterales bacterium]|nr:Uma2 family endonuclease [Bryobacterales bacterium]